MRPSLTFAGLLLAACIPGSLLGGTSDPVTAGTSVDDSSTQQRQAPGYYRFTLGKLTVTALSDGTAAIAWDEILHGLPSDRIRRIFEHFGESAQRDTSINAFLVDTGSRRILIDTGAGTLFGKCCGRLPAALRQAGYSPGAIDVVLLTHVHGDHSAGLSANGERLFPNADVYLARDEYDYWMSDVAREQAPAEHQDMFVEGRAALAPYDKAGRLRFFTGTTSLFPEITAIPAPGHTPGHSFFRITSEGDQLLVVGDIIHAAEVQLSFPAVTARFDVDSDQARATRKHALARLAQTRQLVAANHVSFPGLGRITQHAGTYRWAAMPYRGAVEAAAD